MNQDQTSKYQPRVDDWVDFTGQHYGLDQLHARLIASVLLPTTRDVEPTWLCVESPFHKFWDHLNTAMGRMGLPSLLSHFDLYTLRPRTMQEVYQKIIRGRGEPRIMLDTEWAHPIHFPVHVRSRFHTVRAQFARVRIPLPVTTLPPSGCEEEMYRLLNLLIDREHREWGPQPVQMNDVLERVIGALGVLNPEVTSDYNALANNLCMIPSGFACLHGRTKLEHEDHMMLLHVIQGGVRRWTWRILEQFTNDYLVNSKEGGGAWTVEQLGRKLGMTRKMVWGECDRLAGDGVLDWPLPPGKGNRRKYMRLGEFWREEVVGVIGGEVRWW